MKRREFMTFLGCGACASFSGALAQQPKKVARVGFLMTGSVEVPESRSALDAFKQGLGERGYIEGQNILLEVREAHSEIGRFPALANELVRLNVDVIVALNSVAARAVRQATDVIPTVVPVMGDPVGDGLVVSLARPGGNVTGLTFLVQNWSRSALPCSRKHCRLSLVSLCSGIRVRTAGQPWTR